MIICGTGGSPSSFGQNRPGPGKDRDYQRIAERVGLIANLDHVRPNSRSISASFSST